MDGLICDWGRTLVFVSVVGDVSVISSLTIHNIHSCKGKFQVMEMSSGSSGSLFLEQFRAGSVTRIPVAASHGSCTWHLQPHPDATQLPLTLGCGLTPAWDLVYPSSWWGKLRGRWWYTGAAR
ncbi:hypothetical protein Pmani_023193 [Petrolisthes manimaculis]|uniref:Uncharacterized protein n=1 Tax=Petrolisthes manimaculis TaxID=1843537 RepID=A0AAE1PCE4_9EUCA|nr:hypothetical protein Pmani_023193 [Petrolisthes manimaculis]